MEKSQQDIRQKCIEKSEYLNTCNNYINGEKTDYLLDIDNRELDKQIEWSHLYAILSFHNMTENTQFSEQILDNIASNFESTFIYEPMTITEETKTTDEERK